MRGLTALLLLPTLTFALQPNRIKTDITFTGEPAVALKTIQNGFVSVGYKFDVRRFAVRDGSGEIEGEAVGVKPFSFAAFSENLKEEGGEAADAGSERGVLKISVDLRRGVLNLPSIAPEEGVQLERTQGAQWFRIGGNQQLRIEPPYEGKWYPEVAVLDASLNVLYSFRSDSPKEEFELELPEGAYYLKVSNVWGMKALKEGMWIESKTPGR